MNFKVSKKYKGSCVLPTLNKSIWAGMTFSINGNDLYAPDIKIAIKKGILISVDKKYNKETAKISHNMTITNISKTSLILGEITLKVGSSLRVNKDDKNIFHINSAQAANLLIIISNDKVLTKKTIKKKAKKKTTKKTNTKVVEYVTPKTGEDKNPIAKAWNFKTKETVEAKKVPRTEEFVEVDREEENIEFIDKEKNTTKKKIKNKKTTKKAKKKKSKKKKRKKTTKKKEKTSKSKKVKTLEPVGDVKPEKTAFDEAIELDSRGNLIGEKPSDTLQHLIDTINAPKDVGFADNEQAQDRYDKRTDME